jgi:hypothetical protein
VGTLAHVFVRSGAIWTEQAKSEPGDGFYGVVALSGDIALVGAPWDDDFQGSASVFILKSGDPCVDASECASGFCADGFCCDTACGGSAPNDCQACSVAAGAPTNGTCWGTTGNVCGGGDACTQPDTCQAGTCTPGAAVDCSDGNDCTTESCDPGVGCVITKLVDGATCSDGDACTLTDVCQSGTCTPGAAVDCSDGNDCTTESCDPLVGCVISALADGTACSDSNVCSDGDTCQAGACAAGNGLDCDDANACTSDGCDPSDPAGCVHTPLLGDPCDDGDLCTVQDTCVDDGAGSATCGAGVALDCDDLNECTSDGCDAGERLHTCERRRRHALHGRRVRRGAVRHRRGRRGGAGGTGGSAGGGMGGLGGSAAGGRVASAALLLVAQAASVALLRVARAARRRRWATGGAARPLVRVARRRGGANRRAGGCACTVVPSDPRTDLRALAGLGLALGAAAARRRRRAA